MFNPFNRSFDQNQEKENDMYNPQSQHTHHHHYAHHEHIHGQRDGFRFGPRHGGPFGGGPFGEGPGPFGGRPFGDGPFGKGGPGRQRQRRGDVKFVLLELLKDQPRTVMN